MLTEVAAPAVPAVVSLVVAWLSYRQASAANRHAALLERQKVNAEAFDQAQRIYRDAIATLEAQLASARSRITELERRLDNIT